MSTDTVEAVAGEQEPVSLTLYADYHHTSSYGVELPPGRSWDEVMQAHVKWDTLFIVWTDQTSVTLQMDFWSENTDTKRPIGFFIEDDATGEELMMAESCAWHRQDGDTA